MAVRTFPPARVIFFPVNLDRPRRPVKDGLPPQTAPGRKKPSLRTIIACQHTTIGTSKNVIENSSTKSALIRHKVSLSPGVWPGRLKTHRAEPLFFIPLLHRGGKDIVSSGNIYVAHATFQANVVIKQGIATIMPTGAFYSEIANMP